MEGLSAREAILKLLKLLRLRLENIKFVHIRNTPCSTRTTISSLNVNNCSRNCEPGTDLFIGSQFRERLFTLLRTDNTSIGYYLGCKQVAYPTHTHCKHLLE